MGSLAGSKGGIKEDLKKKLIRKKDDQSSKKIRIGKKDSHRKNNAK